MNSETDDDEGSWIALEAVTRNVVLLLRMRSEFRAAPAAGRGADVSTDAAVPPDVASAESDSLEMVSLVDLMRSSQ